LHQFPYLNKNFQFEKKYNFKINQKMQGKIIFNFNIQKLKIQKNIQRFIIVGI